MRYKLTRFSVCAWAIVVSMVGSRTLGAPLPRLQVSQTNPHSLVTQTGEPYFLNVDTAWAVAWKLDRESVQAYLQHRKAQRFNAIALVAFPSGLDSTSFDKQNVYGDPPFELINGKWNPANPILTPGSGPSNGTEYDYWDHLSYIIKTAAANQMYVILLPTWGNYVTGTWSGTNTSEIIFNRTNAYGYARFLGDHYRAQSNIVWMLGGDRSAIYGSRDYRPVFRSLAEGIADGVNGTGSQDNLADYSTTLISYHPRKDSVSSSAWFQAETWLDFNSTQDWPNVQIGRISKDYRLSPRKATWLFEGRYEAYDTSYRDWQTRFQAYQTVFAGGHGHTYGHETVFGFEPGWTSWLDASGALNMQHLYTLMRRVLSPKQFLYRRPDQAIVFGDQGTSGRTTSNRIQALRGTSRSYALIYTANGRNISVNMDALSGPAVKAYWYNPRNGMWQVGETQQTTPNPFATAIPSGAGAPIYQFDPPNLEQDENDWVLLLKLAT